MREMTDVEEKQVGIEMLKYLHETCVKNGLRYFVGFGTLIGAVRHKGYIPWDDDIDCEMPLDDLMKLKSIVNAEWEAGKTYYKVLTMRDPKYYLIQGRIVDTRTHVYTAQYTKNQIEGLGVYIDIFILMGLPKGNELGYARKMFTFRRAVRDFGYITYRKNFIRWIKLHTPYFVYRYIRGENRLFDDVYEAMEKYPFDEAETVLSFGSFYFEKLIVSSEIYRDKVELEFEGFTVYGPVGYDSYLTQIYGDYMTPVPPKERVTHHSFTAYWKEG